MRWIPSFFADPSNPNHLTQREYQILQLLANGLSNKEIAIALCLSDKTVGTHMKSLFGKLDVHNRVMAVRIGQNLGLINSDEDVMLEQGGMIAIQAKMPYLG